MGEKIIVGPIAKGLKTDRLPFFIDNDSFPTLINAYQWRGRVKRKRGTQLIGRLQRFFNSTVSTYNTGSTTITLDGSGNGNLITGFSINSNAPNTSIVPGNVTITAPGPTVFTDPSQNGTLSPSGSINYSTGAITIASQAGAAVSASFNYYPTLPVMGLEDFINSSMAYPGTLGFDTVYSYNIGTSSPYFIYDVSFYKNPSTTTYPGYVQKTNWTPTTWNGQDYQQFYTVNYLGALWATNGINIPFSITNIGMQFKHITNITNIVAGPPATAQLTIVGHGLVVGDFVFVNEVLGVTGINFQTGYVISVIDANNVSVEFPNATLGGAYSSAGIAQYLTNRSDTTKDCIRWYDGDPTNGSPTTPAFSPGAGWVNFMPPLSQAAFSIGDLPAAQYYLVGARIIIPFKDRLLFLGPVIQTSSAGSQVYLQDTVIYSQNGTPYYTASYTNTPNAAIDTPVSATNVFNPILVPTNQTATSPAYFEDQTGFGGNITAGIDQAIVSAGFNEDVIVVGFRDLQTRLAYTGNDIVPFNFFSINREFGSSSTFSAVTLDKGIITRGDKGYVITSQVESARIDLEIPDQVFEMNLINNGAERFCAQRDFINEWIYFTYPGSSISYKFPTQTLFYNYRDHSWGVFFESYTTYGSFRKQSGFTWATAGLIYPSWNVWNDPWNAGQSQLLQPEVIAGNQQGFVLLRDEGTGEATSINIQNFSGSLVTSPDHCLNNGDYIIITGCLGTVGSQVNGKIFSVESPMSSSTFTLNPAISSGTYLGGGLITRLFVPFVQTKQFPVAWGIARKTRLGPQQYLLTKTSMSQIQLLIFLSQNDANAYNIGGIVPSVNPEVLNSGLIYSTVLFTCPEGTNLGLTPSNINLQMVTGSQQQQIWHRMNTSLLGDTVQIGFTISDTQMRTLDVVGKSFAITGATQANPCVLTCTGAFSSNQLITISGVVGMTQLNGNTYLVVSSTSSTVTILVDSTSFTAYSSGGTATQVAPQNPTAEVELHAFVLDVSPSQLLA